jgi:hypothetical protein
MVLVGEGAASSDRDESGITLGGKDGHAASFPPHAGWPAFIAAWLSSLPRSAPPCPSTG